MCDYMLNGIVLTHQSFIQIDHICPILNPSSYHPTSHTRTHTHTLTLYANQTQQWVYKVCLPTGTYAKNSGNDIQFMRELHATIECKGIPAHPPIE